MYLINMRSDKFLTVLTLALLIMSGCLSKPEFLMVELKEVLIIPAQNNNAESENTVIITVYLINHSNSVIIFDLNGLKTGKHYILADSINLNIDYYGQVDDFTPNPSLEGIYIRSDKVELLPENKITLCFKSPIFFEEDFKKSVNSFEESKDIQLYYQFLREKKNDQDIVVYLEIMDDLYKSLRIRIDDIRKE
jgi:hypothetical protein